MSTDATKNGSGNGVLNGHAHNRINGHLGKPLPDDLPPHNLKAERQVLGACLLDNSVIPDVLEILQSDDFYRESHSITFGVISELYRQGVAIDAVSLADELELRGQFAEIGGDDGLEEIASSVPHAANATYHATIIKEHSVARQLIQGATEIIRDGYSKRYTARELVERQAMRQIHLETISADVNGDERRLAAAMEDLKPWPEPIGPAGYQGLTGRIVEMIKPHTEADQNAILVQFLVAVGNLIGRNPHWQIEATRHALNLFCCVVGDSAKARKGTSWDIVRWLLGKCEAGPNGLPNDKSWAESRILSGLSSGEGLIWQVRDSITKKERQEGIFREIEVDPGEIDKRALWVESEFGSSLAILNREGNSLSGYMRQAWDSGSLRSATKNNPARCTNAHISVIGHITADELHRRLTSTDAANGFANRILWVCARRQQFLPFGGRFHRVDWREVVNELRDIMQFAWEQVDGRIPLQFTPEARERWADIYCELTQSRPGLLGSVTSRAEAQTLRLAALYAVLDRSHQIHVEHLEAGLAVWLYCDRSATYIFAGEGDDDRQAEKVLDALREAGDEGLKLWEIGRKVFGGRNLADRDKCLLALMRQGLIEKEPPDGQIKKATTAVKWRLRKITPAQTVQTVQSTEIDGSKPDAPAF